MSFLEMILSIGPFLKILLNCLPNVHRLDSHTSLWIHESLQVKKKILIFRDGRAARGTSPCVRFVEFIAYTVFRFILGVYIFACFCNMI